MTFVALAADYDGTLAHHERVDAETLKALAWLKARGKFLILVTGRELPELQSLFPELSMFDAVVAENGALLFVPGAGPPRRLAESPPPQLLAKLMARGVAPLSVGASIIATWEPNETIILEIVKELGLEWQIVFNKGAVMCLPPGVNKASGLAAALVHLKLSPLNVLAVGDAQNDHAFLSACGGSAAVANAIEAIKTAAHIRLQADHGAGVRELIDLWLGESGRLAVNPPPAQISAADSETDADGFLDPNKEAILIAGQSGAGKSSLATALIERAQKTSSQIVVLDPEGDYQNLQNITHLGESARAPASAEVLENLADPSANLVVNLLATPLADRPGFFAEIAGGVTSLRARLGRPHWTIIDEAHHFLPKESDIGAVITPQDASGFIFLTAEPESLAPAILDAITTLIAIGPAAPHALALFARRLGLSPPILAPPSDDQMVIWRHREGGPHILPQARARQRHDRHIRKYAEGELSSDKSFYFTGSEQKLNLRAKNLMTFLELAAGVDEETFNHHLKKNDYSRWIENAIGDCELAAEIAAIERSESERARAFDQVRAAIERRYTAPS